VSLYSRPGNDLTYRFPLIVEALAKLRSRSCIVDREPWRVVSTGTHPSIASGIGTMMTAYFSMPSIRQCDNPPEAEDVRNASRLLLPPNLPSDDLRHRKGVR
jgi:hypothetical protein